MIATAKITYVSTSAQKTRLVADAIRGRSVNEALAILRFTKKHVARDLEKLLKSAVANAENRKDRPVDVDDLVVKSIQVNGASLKMRKRTLPAPMGRAYRVQRRQCHITIGLDVKE